AADGVHVHPLNTVPYLDEIARPQLEEGARRADRNLDGFEVIVPAFLAVGDTDDERAEWREMARMQVGFYGSTPNYGFIFEQLGFPGTTEALRERQKGGGLGGVAEGVTDEILAHLVTPGTWSTIAGAIAERYGGRATRVVDYFGTMAWTRDPD